MGNKARQRRFWESTVMNNRSYLDYYNRLCELAISSFDWHNLPSTVDERFLELTLFSKGKNVFFKDDVLGYLCLPVTVDGQLNLYNEPTSRRAYASNGYTNHLGMTDSVVGYNNMLQTSSMPVMELYARRLYNIDRIIDINTNAMKTPILIECDETQLLTMENIYRDYDGNKPVITVQKGFSNTNKLQVLKTDSPYVADKLYQLKEKYWNEALTNLGIATAETKRERMVTNEAMQDLGDVLASRNVRMKARRQFCKKVNDMFKLNISVDFHDFIFDEEKLAKEVHEDE